MPGDSDDSRRRSGPDESDPDSQYGADADGWRDDGWDDPDTLYEDESTELSVTELLRTGFEGVVSTTGLVIAALLVPLSLLATVVRQTLTAEYIASMRQLLTDPESAPTFEGAAAGREEILELLDALGPFPLALDLPSWALVLAVVVPPFLAEAIRIVGVRAFAAGELDGVPAALARRRLLAATVLGWFGGSVLLIGLSLGVALLVLPGLALATVMLFYRQEVAVADKGVLASIRGSWRLTKNHRIELFGLLVVVAVIGFAVSSVLGTVVTTVLPGTLAGPIATAVGQAIGVVFAMGAVTEAYVQLRDARRGPEF